MQTVDQIVSEFAQPVQRFASAYLSERIVRRLWQLVFALFILTVAAAAWTKPLFDWDTVAYIAVAIEPGYETNEELHRAAFAEVEKHAAPVGKWYEFTAANPYKQHMYQNADDFVSQLPMYRVKPAYIWMIRAFSNIADPFTATKIIAVLSVLASGLVVFLWLNQRDMIHMTALVVPIMLLAQYMEAALFATPDLSSTALSLGGIYCLMRGRDWWALPLLFGAFLMRIDAIIFLFALLLAALAFQTAVRVTLIAFASALAAYFVIVSGTGHIGWWPHYVFATVEIQNTLIGFHPEFSIATYLDGLFRGLVIGLRDYRWMPMVALMIVAGFMLASAGKPFSGRSKMLLAALGLTFIGKFITFPLPVDRNYLPFVVAMALILIVEVWRPANFSSGRLTERA